MTALLGLYQQCSHLKIGKSRGIGLKRISRESSSSKTLLYQETGQKVSGDPSLFLNPGHQFTQSWGKLVWASLSQGSALRNTQTHGQLLSQHEYSWHLVGPRYMFINYMNELISQAWSLCP